MSKVTCCLFYLHNKVSKSCIKSVHVLKKVDSFASQLNTCVFAVHVQDARHAPPTMATFERRDHVHHQPPPHLRPVSLHGRPIPRGGVPTVSHSERRHGDCQEQDRAQGVCFRQVGTNCRLAIGSVNERCGWHLHKFLELPDSFMNSSCRLYVKAVTSVIHLCVRLAERKSFSNKSMNSTQKTQIKFYKKKSATNATLFYTNVISKCQNNVPHMSPSNT